MFDNCDGNTCFWAMLGLMAVAAILGYLIGRIFGRKSVTNTETVVDNSAADSLRAELNSLKGKYSSLEKEHSSLNTQYLSLQGSASGSADADAALQARIKELEGQVTSLKASAGSGRSDAAAERKRKQEALLASLAAQKGVIDLGRIGAGGPDDKDNLKRLPGLGSLL